MAVALVDESVQALNARIEELEAELAFAKKVRENFTPPEPVEDGTVIRFVKYNLSYAYAAIKAGDLWYITQSGESKYRRAAKTWAELLAWIGERNWHLIEVLG